MFPLLCLSNPAIIPSDLKKILIIEDDERLAMALSVRLKAQGYATWIAADAIAAVAHALRIKPDLVLLDVSLPAGNGFSVIEQFDQFAETQEIPIILATASKDPDLRRKALDSGAAGLLRKPYDSEELLHVVEQALESWNSGNFCAEDDVSHKDKRKRVLIVEDDEKVAMALAIRMGAAGFETTVANDALSGVRCAVTTKPDVIVLDISLPAGDGFVVAERIQAHIPHPARIIFLTASKRADFREKASHLGAVGFFEKPYESEALLTAVEQALAN